MVKCLPTMQETQALSLGRKDLLEKEVATHCRTLAWKIPWTEEPGRLQSLGSRVTKSQTQLSDFTFTSNNVLSVKTSIKKVDVIPVSLLD